MALAGRREQTGREYMVVPSQKVEVKLENINIKKKVGLRHKIYLCSIVLPGNYGGWRPGLS